jgi:uncharacterized RDD family membrane protein YckC
METNEILDSNVLDSQPNYLKDYSMASQGKRFANYLIDRIIIFILSVIIQFLLMSWELYITDRLTSILITMLILVCYYITIEGSTGKSIGKMITGTRVLTDDFEKPEFGIIVKRSFCRIIPFDAFSFLGSAGWHDTISNTIVVED